MNDVLIGVSDMKKIQYSVYKQETGSAGGKAKNDAYDILLNSGYMPSYVPSNKRNIRMIQQILSLQKLNEKVLLVIQYPAISSKIMSLLLKRIEKVKCKSVALIHDLPSIQGMGGETQFEIEELNHFDYLIVHNTKMEEYLFDCGYRGKIVVLELFDYLHDIERNVTETPYSGTISVAGNLDKAPYICDLEKVGRYKFNLYGINKTLDLSNLSNVDYKGCLPSDEIPYLLDADYGLVWDGDSVDTCSGVYGKYLLYNNPHKLSLYIAAGKPVIVWSNSAVADFVLKNKIGIAVDSLIDLNQIDLFDNYKELKQNALKIKQKISSGYFLKTAIEKIEKEIAKK